MLILVINPGSTSTKIAVYDDEKPILLRTINHSAEELSQFDDVLEQQSFRKQVLLNELQQAHLPMKFDAIIGRGGLVKPLEGGVYEINEQMVIDTHSGIAMHNHACNLGCLIAYEIALEIPGCRAFPYIRLADDEPHLYLACSQSARHSPALCCRNRQTIRRPEPDCLSYGWRYLDSCS